MATAATPTPVPGVQVTQPSGAVVSRVTDARVSSPNSLAISSKNPGLAYVMNQEGAPVVFVIQLSTGKVVGTTVLSGTETDKPRAMAVAGGRLWIADLGDSRRERFGGTIYSVAEPGRGARQATPRSYPVTFGGLASDINGLLIEPRSDQMYLVSRSQLAEGTFWKLPDPLRAGAANRAVPEAKTVTADATDAVFTPNGRKVLVLTDKEVRAFDPRTWEETAIVLPKPGTVPNGRGIAVSPDAKSFYVVSEPGTGTTAAGGSVIAKFPLTRQLGGVGVAAEPRDAAAASGTAGPKTVTVSPAVVVPLAVLVAAGMILVVVRRVRLDRRAAKAHAENFPGGS